MKIRDVFEYRFNRLKACVPIDKIETMTVDEGDWEALVDEAFDATDPSKWYLGPVSESHTNWLTDAIADWRKRKHAAIKSGSVTVFGVNVVRKTEVK